jgi:membrane protein YqaA with SNARE-associated domain
MSPRTQAKGKRKPTGIFRIIGIDGGGGLVGSKWYSIVIAVLAALDAFVFFVPNEALLISAVFGRSKHWVTTALAMSFGSAAGAALFGFLASRYGEVLVRSLFPSLLSSRSWVDSVRFIHRHGGWGLAVISLSPLPQHAAVAIAGLAHLSVKKIFLSVFAGRSLKYFILAWCSVRSQGLPSLLKRLHCVVRAVNWRA